MRPNTTILAIDPMSRAFAFALLEVPNSLIEWGLKHAPSRKGDLLERVDDLIARYRPTAFVVEDVGAPGCLRRARARRQIRALERQALSQGLALQRVSRLAVLNTLAPGKGKYEVALHLAETFPDLLPRLPRKRKAWMVEDARMSIFDAASFALAAEGATAAPSGREGNASRRTPARGKAAA